jgi:K+-sensing histidine kinase KdpD
VYSTSSLAALRQLALRFAVRRAELQLGREDGVALMPAGAMLVLVDGGPGCRDAIRRGAALAASLDLRLVAVAPGARTAGGGVGGTAIDAAAVADDLELARDLGAAVVAATGRDMVDAVLDTAARARAGHVVLPSRASTLGERLRGRTIVERLAAELNLELHLVPGHEPDR